MDAYATPPPSDLGSPGLCAGTIQALPSPSRLHRAQPTNKRPHRAVWPAMNVGPDRVPRLGIETVHHVTERPHSQMLPMSRSRRRRTSPLGPYAMSVETPATAQRPPPPTTLRPRPLSSTPMDISPLRPGPRHPWRQASPGVAISENRFTSPDRIERLAPLPLRQ